MCVSETHYLKMERRGVILMARKREMVWRGGEGAKGGRAGDRKRRVGAAARQRGSGDGASCGRGGRGKSGE